MTVTTTDFHIQQRALGMLRRADALLKYLQELYGDPPGEIPDASVRRGAVETERLLIRVCIQTLTGRSWSSSRIAPVQVVIPPPAQRCHVCGCTEEAGCPSVCHWSSPDLCSVCAELAFHVTPDIPT